MAEQKTVDKVKELLQGHCYEPLRDAAEKWLATADEKFDVKDKAGKAWDKLGEAADKYSEASMKFNERMDGAGEKFTEAADKFADNAAPVADKAKDISDKVADKAKDIGENVADKAKDAKEKAAEVELIAQLKEGISTVKENIDFFGSDEAKEKFGEDTAAQIKKHAEELKAQGKTYCDCEACTKARELLKDLGEDIGE